MELNLIKEKWALTEPFSISHKTMTFAEVVVLEVSAEGHTGRAEANPFARYGQTADSVISDIEAVRAKIEAGISIQQAQTLLPASSARNALDCALWDLKAKQSGQRIWQLTGIPEPGPLSGSITIGLDEADIMARKARQHAASFALLKIKLGQHQPLERLEAVRDSAPSARLFVDVNEAWSLEELAAYAPRLQALGVEMIEQPLRRSADQALLDYACPLPLATDESCFDRGDLDHLQGRYDFINIKLDKTGGLSEGLALARAAKKRGFRLMVGCMAGTSLAMAPGFVLAALCEYRDLDGALLLDKDRAPGMEFCNGMIQPIPASLWG